MREVPPQLQREDKPINDWFPHGTLRLTLTGVLAKSSNIGTVRAVDGGLGFVTGRHSGGVRVAGRYQDR